MVKREILAEVIAYRDHSWRRLSLRHLVALDTVAAAGSFRAAARQLGYTQSAVSEQIAALEAIVGQRLLDRPPGRRRARLTPAGSALLAHAAGIADRVVAARADLEAIRAGRITLRLGIYESAAVRLLPGIVRGLRHALPDIDVRLAEAADDGDLLRLLERGELDACFTVLPLEPGPFAAAELLEDPYLLLVASDSPLATLGSVPVDALASLPLIDYRDLRYVHHTMSKLPPEARPPAVVLRSDDNATIHALVAGDLGVAGLPRLSIDLRNPGGRAVPLDPPLPPRRLAVAWHEQRLPTPAIETLVDVAIAVTHSLESAGASPGP